MCAKTDKNLLKFYASILLSSWGDRIWFFALSVYFIEINKNTLIVNAINGFSICAMYILLGATIGSIVDKNQRISVVRYSLLIQNTTVALNCAIIVTLILFGDYFHSISNGTLIYILQGVVILFNIFSSLSSQATKIAIQRDWVVVISESIKVKSEPEPVEATKGPKKNYKLAKLNATVRRIDLCTNIIAPIFAGAVMSFANISTKFSGVVLSAIGLAAWNLISYAFEYRLLLSIYENIPKLHKDMEQVHKEKKESLFQVLKSSSILYKGWMTYFKQGAMCLPGLSLALLYLTVLSFDSINIAYAKSQHLSESAISILQAVGSLTGIFGTIAFQLFHNKCKINLKVIGLIGSLSQLSCLVISLVSIWMPGSAFELYTDSMRKYSNETLGLSNSTSSIEQSFLNTTSIEDLLTNTTAIMTTESIPLVNSIKNRFFLSQTQSYVSILMLLGGTALSRFGLWLFDLSVNQVIQESVDEKERGVVGGVQGSLNMIFDLFKYTSVMFFSKMDKYGYLVIISFSAVSVSATLYLAYFCISSIRGKYEAVPQSDAAAATKGAEIVEVEMQEIN